MSDNATLTETGHRLREAANSAGLTLRELGVRMAVSRPTIYAYASGALKMNSKRVAQAAEITGRPVGYFEPRSVEDLDPRSDTIQSFRLIDALLAPPSALKASEAAQDALDSTREGEVPRIRAELLRKLGVALVQTGDYVGAVRHLEQALNTFLIENELEKQASCLQTLGFCYLSLGQIERASECFLQAKAAHLPEFKWKASIAMAALAERIGEFSSAETQLSQLLDDPSLDEVALTYVRANFSSIVCAQGRWKSGLAQSETALEAAFAAGLNDQVSELLIQTALALLHLGRLEESTMMVVRARDVAFTLKDEARSTLTDVVLARLLFAFGEESAARTAAARAYSRALKGQFRRSESQSLLLLAELAYARDEDQATQELADQLRSHSHAHQLVVTSTLASILEAKALIRLDRLHEAEHLLSFADQQLENMGNGRPRLLSMEARALWNQRAGNRVLAHKGFLEAALLAESQDLVPDAIRIYASLQDSELSSEATTGNLNLETRIKDLRLISKELCPSPQVWKRFLTGWLPEVGAASSQMGKKS